MCASDFLFAQYIFFVRQHLSLSSTIMNNNNASDVSHRSWTVQVLERGVWIMRGIALWRSPGFLVCIILAIGLAFFSSLSSEHQITAVEYMNDSIERYVYPIVEWLAFCLSPVCHGYNYAVFWSVKILGGGPVLQIPCRSQIQRLSRYSLAAKSG